MKINKKYIVTAILLSFALTSLNTADAFGKKKKQTPAVQIEQTQELTNEKHSVFTLNDCIEIAIKNNPSIRAYIYDEEVYKSKIGQAWANYFPSISAGLDVSRLRNSYSQGSMYGNTTMNYTMGYVPSVSADMLIFDFGKTKASADYAKRTYESKKEDTKENINSIIYNIKATYYNILFAQAQVKVYEDTVSDYQLQLDQAWGFYRLGKKAKIDVVTAEYNLGNAKLNLVKAKDVLEVAQIQLSKIMGIPEYTNYELSDELSLKDYNLSVEDAIKKAMEVRPELISAEKLVKAAKMNLRAARREYTPDLNIYGGFDNGIGNQFNMTSAQVGAGLSYSGLNIAKVKKQIDGAKAQYKKAQAEYQNTKDTVYFNVKKNYINLQTEKESVAIAKLALDQAKEQYRQATGRYKAGVGDAIELKDGENTYLNARLDFYNAVLDYNVAASSLEREIGVPLEFSDENILEISPEDL